MKETRPVGKEIILPSGDKAPLSAAYRSNGFLFTSGQLAFDADARLNTGDIKEQTQLCLANIQKLLELEALSNEHVVKVTVWLTHLEDFAGFNAAYIEFFGGHRPARSTVRSDLMLPGARVEIEAVATYQEV